MNRTTVLEEADRLICNDREEDYGDPHVNFAHIAERWSQYMDVTIHPWQVALMMVDLKVARMASTRAPHDDSLIDIAGYTALAAELAHD